MQEPLTVWNTRDCHIAVDARGHLADWRTRRDQRALLAPGQPAPLLQVRVGGALLAPRHATWTSKTRQIALHFGDGPSAVRATLVVTPKPTHVAFELIDLQPAAAVELVVWGPYPTLLAETVGEIVGVVRDRRTALGIQALNAKTLGGFPNHEHDIEPDFAADDTGVYPDLPDALKKDQLFRGDTARRTPFGAVVQAYCRNRDRTRTIENWGVARFPALPFADGGPVGSRIALFAVPEKRALDTIGAIELAEGLPHPLLDGVWAKKSPAATDSYLIVDFGEATIDQAIQMTKRAGLRWLYHSSPFETWGHFRLKPALFPHGVDGLRACVDKAAKEGVRVGFHTLSNFLTPNDPYVTPRPDPRLARSGASALTDAVDAAQREIPVADPDPFRAATPMRTVAIGDELIRYERVSDAAPWRLLGCERGAFGTRPAAHPRGGAVGKLMDHGYNVFLTDAALSQEVARNIAALCNQTGTRQISLDGLEGNWSTGMGQYGRTLFTQAWYDALAPAARDQINDASNPGHWNWHVATRMNWGEPWYAGFRESQTLYRFKNQLHYSRNLMPRMLGWFALRPETTVDDAQWLLARAAGFDAGFALATSLASTAQLDADPASAETARRFGSVPAILEAIRQWETARRAGAFPEKVKALLRDNAREFHLEPTGPGRWDLHPLENGRRGAPIRLAARRRP